MPGVPFFGTLGKEATAAAAGENSNGFVPIPDKSGQGQGNIPQLPQAQAIPQMQNAQQYQLGATQPAMGAENRGAMAQSAAMSAHQAGAAVSQPAMQSGAGGLGAAIANLHAANAIASQQPGVAQSVQAQAPERQPAAESARQQADVQSGVQDANDDTNAPYPIVSSFDYNNYGI